MPGSADIASLACESCSSRLSQAPSRRQGREQKRLCSGPQESQHHVGALFSSRRGLRFVPGIPGLRAFVARTGEVLGFSCGAVRSEVSLSLLLKRSRRNGSLSDCLQHPLFFRALGSKSPFQTLCNVSQTARLEKLKQRSMTRPTQRPSSPPPKPWEDRPFASLG